MGKEKKKVCKNKKRQQEKIMQQEFAKQKETLMMQMEAGEYGQALDTIAELITAKCYEPEIMYMAAKAYFYTGDYERSAKWVNNTLHYDGSHIGARLLLARVCLVEDRNDDAMKLYEFVLRNGKRELTAEEQEDILEATYYIVRTEEDWLHEHYPLVEAFIQEHGQESTESVKQESEIRPAEEIKQEEASAGLSIAEITAEVMEKPVSLREKAKIFNKFAGGLYLEKNFAAAKQLLEKAMEIDGHDDETLRNMAVVEKALGNGAAAMDYMSRMSVTDFMLLEHLS